MTAVHPLGAVRSRFTDDDGCACPWCTHRAVATDTAGLWTVLALANGRYTLTRPGWDCHDEFASAEAAVMAGHNGGYWWLDPFENADPEFEWRELDVTPVVPLANYH